jgi:predicted GIY-YIG superfamily endonuclease
MDAPFFVYILASKRNGTLYIGVINNLARRLSEHKAKLVPGFTRQYEVDQLVYFEAFDSILEARERTFLEALAPRMEDRLDREAQSGLARSDRRIEFLRHLQDACSCPGCCAAPR